MYSYQRPLVASALALAVLVGCSPKEEPKPEAQKPTTATETKTETASKPAETAQKPVELAKPEGADKTEAPTDRVKTDTAKPDTKTGEKPKEEKPKEANGGKEKYITTASGLKYAVLKEGTGKLLQRGQTALVHYRGTFEDGKEFDSSYKRGQPFPCPVGVHAVIEGWDEALLGMKVGEKRKLIIPGNLAYGAEGRPGAIPPNATLLFDIEVMGLQE